MKSSYETQPVIITDLDGSLLDYATYSYNISRPEIDKLKSKGIPIIFCSSKTRAEQEFYQHELGIADPFIVENGSAIFIRKGYFLFPFEHQRETRDYDVIEIGTSYQQVRQKLKGVSQKLNVTIRGFGDMDDAEVADLTGLDIPMAKMAKERQYEETLNLKADELDVGTFIKELENAGLRCNRGGRFYAVGGSDKGKATQTVTNLFKKKYGRIRTIGIGDSMNDRPMLYHVDIPVLLQKPGNHWEEIDIEDLHRIDEAGPQGWARAIRELIK